MTLVLDCVPYFQEADIWRLRYETLKDVVDGFVVVEAAHTHAGAFKGKHFVRPEAHGDGPPVWYDLFDLPDPYLPGIPATRRREMYQRNCITQVVAAQVVPPDDTILLIGDCDEIPRPEVVWALRDRGLYDGEVIALLMRLHYYNLNTTSPQPWPGTRAARWADVRALSPHVIRCGLGQPDAHYPIHLSIANAGWHLSYFGGPDAVQCKMRSFLHQELVTEENTRPEAIAARLNAGLDVWGRANNGHGLVLGPASDVPPPVAADPARWAHFFHPDYAPTEARNA